MLPDPGPSVVGEVGTAYQAPHVSAYAQSAYGDVMAWTYPYLVILARDAAGQPRPANVVDPPPQGDCSNYLESGGGRTCVGANVTLVTDGDLTVHGNYSQLFLASWMSWQTAVVGIPWQPHWNILARSNDTRLYFYPNGQSDATHINVTVAGLPARFSTYSDAQSLQLSLNSSVQADAQVTGWASNVDLVLPRDLPWRLYMKGGDLTVNGRFSAREAPYGVHLVGQSTTYDTAARRLNLSFFIGDSHIRITGGEPIYIHPELDEIPARAFWTNDDAPTFVLVAPTPTATPAPTTHPASGVLAAIVLVCAAVAAARRRSA